MKKNELKNGMVVELRNGDKRLVFDNNILGNNGFDHLSNYKNNLKNTINSNLDIVKVYKYKFARSFYSILDYDNLNLIWERKEIKLTHKEIEILKALKVLDYEFLARDEDSYFYAFNVKPYKEEHRWVLDLNDVTIGDYVNVNSDIFDFIKWEDKEPTSIDELLKGV